MIEAPVQIPIRDVKSEEPKKEESAVPAVSKEAPVCRLYICASLRELVPSELCLPFSLTNSIFSRAKKPRPMSRFLLYQRKKSLSF